MAETVPGDFGFLAAARRRDPLLSERLHASISRWLDVLDEQLDSVDHPDEPPLARIHRSKLDGAGCRAGGEFGGCGGARRAVPGADRSEEPSLSAARGR